MNKMVDPRTCINFKAPDICPNRDKEILTCLDNREISDMCLSFPPEMFDKTFEYCATCAHYASLAKIKDQCQTTHWICSP